MPLRSWGSSNEQTGQIRAPAPSLGGHRSRLWVSCPILCRPLSLPLPPPLPHPCSSSARLGALSGHPASGLILHTPFSKDVIPENRSETLRGFHFSCSAHLCHLPCSAEPPPAWKAQIPAPASLLLLSSCSPPFLPRSPDISVMSFIAGKSIFGHYPSTLIASSSQNAFFCNLILVPVSLKNCQFSAHACDLSLVFLPGQCALSGATGLPGHLTPPTEDERIQHQRGFITGETKAPRTPMTHVLRAGGPNLNPLLCNFPRLA